MVSKTVTRSLLCLATVASALPKGGEDGNKQPEWFQRNLKAIQSVYDSTVSPANSASAKQGRKAVRGLFAPDAIGRVNPDGKFADFEDSIEDFFALAPAPKINAASTEGTYEAEIVDFVSDCPDVASSLVYFRPAVEEKKVSSDAHRTLRRRASNDDIVLSQVAFWRFNDAGEIEKFQAWLPDLQAWADEEAAPEHGFTCSTSAARHSKRDDHPSSYEEKPTQQSPPTPPKPDSPKPDSPKDTPPTHDTPKQKSYGEEEHPDKPHEDSPTPPKPDTPKKPDTPAQPYGGNKQPDKPTEKPPTSPKQDTPPSPPHNQPPTSPQAPSGYGASAALPVAQQNAGSSPSKPPTGPSQGQNQGSVPPPNVNAPQGASGLGSQHGPPTSQNGAPSTQSQQNAQNGMPGAPQPNSQDGMDSMIPPQNGHNGMPGGSQPSASNGMGSMMPQQNAQNGMGSTSGRPSGMIPGSGSMSDALGQQSAQQAGMGMGPGGMGPSSIGGPLGQQNAQPGSFNPQTAQNGLSGAPIPPQGAFPGK